MVHDVERKRKEYRTRFFNDEMNRILAQHGDIRVKDETLGAFAAEICNDLDVIVELSKEFVLLGESIKSLHETFNK